MLNEYFAKSSVSRIIKEIKNNERYFQKKSNLSCDSFICISNEAALYMFYEALYKYKVIIDDEFLFDDYIDQVEKLYRKLDNFDSIKFGINKLICTTLIIKLGIKDSKSIEAKETIIKHVYDKYIRNGYFIHGFHSSYVEDVKRNGFIPEVYDNCYTRFSKINSIFSKYNCPIVVGKNFNEKEVYLTDDFVMGCYYSIYAPLFYYKFLFRFNIFINFIFYFFLSQNMLN